MEQSKNILVIEYINLKQKKVIKCQKCIIFHIGEYN